MCFIVQVDIKRSMCASVQQGGLYTMFSADST